jgi:hypothetical protein
MTSKGTFIQRSIDEAWQLFDLIHHNSETWSILSDNKGIIELNTNAYKPSWKKVVLRI